MRPHANIVNGLIAVLVPVALLNIPAAAEGTDAAAASKNGPVKSRSGVSGAADFANSARNTPSGSADAQRGNAKVCQSLRDKAIQSGRHYWWANYHKCLDRNGQ